MNKLSLFLIPLFALIGVFLASSSASAATQLDGILKPLTGPIEYGNYGSYVSFNQIEDLRDFISPSLCGVAYNPLSAFSSRVVSQRVSASGAKSIEFSTFQTGAGTVSFNTSGASFSSSQPFSSFVINSNGTCTHNANRNIANIANATSLTIWWSGDLVGYNYPDGYEGLLAPDGYWSITDENGGDPDASLDSTVLYTIFGWVIAIAVFIIIRKMILGRR